MVESRVNDIDYQPRPWWGRALDSTAEPNERFGPVRRLSGVTVVVRVEYRSELTEGQWCELGHWTLTRNHRHPGVQWRQGDRFDDPVFGTIRRWFE